MNKTDGEEQRIYARNPSIGTHDGNFHADEVLACCMLQRLPEYKSAAIVRTRNPDVLRSCDVVVDVGGCYDPVNNRYDHHQRGFCETLGVGRHDRVKLSSAGLIYRHFGKRLIEAALERMRAVSCVHPNEDTDKDTTIRMVYTALYAKFIEAVDAIDNGESCYDTQRSARPLYQQCTSLSTRVARMNAFWNEEYTPERQMERFGVAMRMVGRELDEMLERDIIASWLPGRKHTWNAVKETSHISSPELLVLLRFCPWRDHLHDLEEEDPVFRESGRRVLYVVYPEDDERSDTRWRIQAVSVAPGSFESRRPLPQKWRGLGGAELSRVVGMPGCVFVHAAGFIGGHEHMEGAVEMGKRGIALHDI